MYVLKYKYHLFYVNYESVAKMYGSVFEIDCKFYCCWALRLNSVASDG